MSPGATPLLGLVIRSVPIGNGCATREGKLQRGEEALTKPSCTKGGEGPSGTEGGTPAGHSGTGTRADIPTRPLSPYPPRIPSQQDGGCCPAVAGPSGYAGLANTLLLAANPKRLNRLCWKLGATAPTVCVPTAAFQGLKEALWGPGGCSFAPHLPQTHLCAADCPDLPRFPQAAVPRTGRGRRRRPRPGVGN